MNLKMSEGQKRRFARPEEREKNANQRKGKHASPESKIKCSESVKNTWLDPEIRAKRLAGSNRPDVIAKNREMHAGKKLSKETRHKMSVARIGYKASPETCKKLRALNSGENNPQYGKHPTEESREKMSKSQKISQARPEVKAKLSAARSGEKHYNWKGGISSFPYCPKFNKKLKEEIRNAFGRRCFLCNVSEKQNDKLLDVHHVDYNKGQGCGQRWSLIPLCRVCHTKTNFYRWYWFALLSNYWAIGYFTAWGTI